MSFGREMKASFAVMIITAPLFFITGIIWFWAVLQFVDFSKNLVAFFATALPFLIAWAIFQRRLSKRLEERWERREASRQSVRS